MSPGPVTPTLANALRSLAESQLQVQASRSATLDAGAIGVMAIDVAVAAIALVARSGQPPRGIVLVLLGLSAGLAARALFLDGTPHLGPSVTHVIAAHRTHSNRALENSILLDLAADVHANRHALARKAPWLMRAFVLLGMAATLTLAEGVH